jgi:tetratricopeptide (TPR) repeat protein
LQVTSEKELITAKIEAKYSTGSREEFRTVENVKFNLYGRDYLTWDDPSKAAAFVTSGDQCIIDFAASVVKQESSVVPFFTRNMNYALRLYEAMRALGCDWVADKTTPFSKVKIGKTEYVVDNVKYPAQFLASKSKAGDCDDLSVLFVTLLESVGVETALLSTATHLFTMFNTDIPAGRKTSLPIDTTYFVSHRGTLWMPVEATIFPASFVEAWRKGKEKYLTESPEIFDISDHQQEDRYPPASISYAAACSVAVPNVIDAVSKSSVVIAGMRDTYLEKYTREIAQDRSNLSLRNFYATILGQNDQRQEARAQLDTFFLILAQNKKRQKAQAQPDTIAKNNSTYAAALNNLANIEFVEGNFDKAESYYRDANLYNQYDKTGTYLNLAYLYAIWMTKDAASEKINKAKCIQTLKDALPWLNGDPNKTFLVLNLPASRLQGKGEKGEIDKKLPSPSPAPPDSLVKKSQQDTTRVQQQNESGFAKKAKSLVDFFINYFKSLLQGPPPSDLTFDGAGAKNDGELDEDRARILWWNTGLVLSNP